MTPADQDLFPGQLVGSLHDIVADALSAYDRGDLKRAEEILRQVVEARSDLATAWHIRGLVAQRRGDLVRASEYLAVAVSRAPDNPVYCRDLGVSLIGRGQQREAFDLLNRAVSLAPDDAPALFHLGNILIDHGRPDEALSLYRRVALLEPHSAEAHNNLAVALRESGDFGAAIAAAETALEIDPEHTEALNNLGLALCDARRYPEAISQLEAAIRQHPDDADLFNNLGVALHAAGRLDEAEQQFANALRLRTGWGEASLNLGNLLRQRGRIEDAVACYRQALAADSRNVKCFGNLGIALLNLNKPEEAIAVYEMALSIEPENADIRMSLGISQLMAGNYAAGWENYEWRWKASSFTSRQRAFGSPRWNGDATAGRRILVHAEQGFGDTLQFCRYLPLLAERGAEVVFECQPALVSLCTSLDGVAEVIPRDAPPPETDFHVPLLSLPHLFATTLTSIPAVVPYLSASRSAVMAWRDRLESDALNVGLVWTGDPKRQDDSMRSCPRYALEPILAVGGIRFVSLQVGDGPDVSIAGIPDFGREFKDFSDTAGAIEAFDLVITVDTAVAHLAGALGRPVWVMLGLHADWRYLLGREDSPWYPTMRLFRQRRRDDWAELADRVAAALKHHAVAGGTD